MKILFLAAEVAPYVSVGGLSQVLYFLPRALIKRGHDVHIFTAKYGTMDKGGSNAWPFLATVSSFDVPVGGGAAEADADAAAEQDKAARDAFEFGGSASAAPSGQTTVPGAIRCSVFTHVPEVGDARAHFVVNEEYYGLRANVFGYADDHVRFALLSKACIIWLSEQRRLIDDGKDGWWPDVIHCHDWHTGYFVELARREPKYSSMLGKTPVVFSVHNFKYQGNGDFRYAPKEQRDDGTAHLSALASPSLQAQNALLRGIMYADAVSTVSPTHAREVLTPEYAEGLEETLTRIKDKLTGILNGIDTTEFDPATDPHIDRRYTRWTVRGARKFNKRRLQREFGLREEPEVPVLAFVGRLSAQKGLDVLMDALPHLLENDERAQFLLVGGGEERFREPLEAMRQRFPDRVGLHPSPDFRLPRRVYAGADIVLMPSSFEPGGIVALEAMRYGAVPLVRRTGGLNDSIEDFDPVAKRGNGFSFLKKDSWALFAAMVHALSLFEQPVVWSKLIANCMAADFSWEHAAADYERWYRRAAQHKRMGTEA